METKMKTGSRNWDYEKWRRSLIHVLTAIAIIGGGGIVLTVADLVVGYRHGIQTQLADVVHGILLMLYGAALVKGKSVADAIVARTAPRKFMQR